jgi:replicative DNA helicase
MKNETIKKLLHPKLANRQEDEKYKIIQIKDFPDVKLSEPFPSGFPSINKHLLGGFRGGELVIISGVSGRGKSLFSLQLAKNFSNQNNPVLFFSFEEPIDRIKWRMNTMGFSEDVIVFAPKQLKSGHVEWLEEKIMDGLANHYTEIVIIDNLDFLTASKDSIDDKWTLQSKIIAMLKRIANEFGVLIFLNSHVKKVDDSRPHMEDLYGSGDIYKLADFVLFVHRLREGTNDKKSIITSEEKPFTDNTDIIIEKNRLTGQLGTIHLKFVNNNLVEIGGWQDEPR